MGLFAYFVELYILNIRKFEDYNRIWQYINLGWRKYQNEV